MWTTYIVKISWFVISYHVTQALDIDSDSDSDGSEEGWGDYARQNFTKCVVLEGLAQAKDLVLIANRSTVRSNIYAFRAYQLFNVKL